MWSLHVVIKFCYFFIYKIRWCQAISLGTTNKNWNYFFAWTQFWEFLIYAVLQEIINTSIGPLAVPTKTERSNPNGTTFVLKFVLFSITESHFYRTEKYLYSNPDRVLSNQEIQPYWYHFWTEICSFFLAESRVYGKSKSFGTNSALALSNQEI